MNCVPWRDGDRKDLCEERRAGHASDSAKRVDGALKLALRGRVNVAGHQGLHGGSCDSPECDKGNDGQDDPAAGGKGEACKSKKAEYEAAENAAALAKAFHERADENAGNQRGAHAHKRQRVANVAVAPGITVFGVESPHGRKGIVGEVVEGDDDGKSSQLGMRTQKADSSEGIGHVPGGFCAALGRERFGKDKIAVDGVGEAEPCCSPKGKAQINIAQIAADGGTNDEPESECSTDEAERLGALFRRSHVGDVGEGGSDVRSGDARNEAANEKPAERGSESHEDVVNGESEAGDENDGAAAETIGPPTEQRGKNELHGGPGKSEIAGDGGGAGKVATLELAD